MTGPNLTGPNLTGPNLTGPGARQQFRTMQRALADASDPQLMRILSMLDAMPQRGEADQLIAPLRPRLAMLRPQRPMTFIRLLFQPLNPLIVAGPDWRRGMLAIPRTALAPLGAQAAACGAGSTSLQPTLASLAADRTDDIRRLGTIIWPEAASFFRTAPPPADWASATGLQEADHRAIAALIAVSLAHATRIEELVHRDAHRIGEAGAEPADHDCEELLEAAMQEDRDGLAIVTALLISRLLHATTVLHVAEDVAARQKDPAARQAADRAIDLLLARLEPTDPRPAGNPEGDAELRRAVCLLTDIAAMANPPPSRRARVDMLRRQIDSSSREKFAAALDDALLRPAAALAGADAATVAGLEEAARDLRRFEQLARRLGGAEHYDQRLRSAGAALQPRAGDPPMTVVDRIRLIEILLGPEAAQAAMSGAVTP